MKNHANRQSLTLLAYFLMASVESVLFIIFPIYNFLHIHVVDIAKFANITIMPAPFIFDAWDGVFLLFAIYAFDQAKRLRKYVQVQARIAPWFWIASLAYCGWVTLLQYNALPLSSVLILIMLAALIVMYGHVTKVAFAQEYQRWATPYWGLRVPLGVSLAWISFITILSISTTLAATRWDGFGLSPTTWGVIMIGFLTLITLAILLKNVDLPFTVTMLWILYGITIGNSDSSLIVRMSEFAQALIIFIAVLRVFFSYKGVWIMPNWIAQVLFRNRL